MIWLLLAAAILALAHLVGRRLRRQQGEMYISDGTRQKILEQRPWVDEHLEVGDE